MNANEKKAMEEAEKKARGPEGAVVLLQAAAVLSLLGKLRLSRKVEAEAEKIRKKMEDEEAEGR